MQLPKGRKVLHFDSFTDNIYYYNEKTEKAIILKIDSLVNINSGVTDTPEVIAYNLENTVFTSDFLKGTVKYEYGKGYTHIKPREQEKDNLTFNEFDEKGNPLGVFTFTKGFTGGSYIRNKDKKEFPFSRIDSNGN